MIREESCIKCEWFKAAQECISYSHNSSTHRQEWHKYYSQKMFHSLSIRCHPLLRSMIYVIILIFIIYWTFTFNNECKMEFQNISFVVHSKCKNLEKHTKLSKMHRVKIYAGVNIIECKNIALSIVDKISNIFLLQYLFYSTKI